MKLISGQDILADVPAHKHIEDIIAAHPDKDWSSLGVASAKQPFSTFIDGRAPGSHDTMNEIA